MCTDAIGEIASFPPHQTSAGGTSVEKKKGVSITNIKCLINYKWQGVMWFKWDLVKEAHCPAGKMGNLKE